MATPLHELNASGQSIWLDYIDRTMLRDGSLTKRIETDALTGMTSNPTIFEKALAEGSAYDDQIGSASVRIRAPGQVLPASWREWAAVSATAMMS